MPEQTDNRIPAHRYTAALADQIEMRWQREWERAEAFRAPNPGEPDFDESKPKRYILDMFPYPSGSGLHVGHPEGYTATDIVARRRRMLGENVLHPMGWDAFGLPAEQYAIQTNVHPRITTQRAIDTFRRQLKRFGFSYDWSREVATIDPAYYRWTQWIWKQCFEAWYDPRAREGAGAARPIRTLVDDLANEKVLVGPSGDLVFPGRGASSTFALSGLPGGGVARRWVELDEDERRAVIDSQRLAYLGEQTVNWCPNLGTVLANEEVINGRSERGGHPVTRAALRQWMFRITAYAERLLSDLALVDWPESTRIQQTEWIGRSEGAEVDFPLEDSSAVVRVFTTRPDTIFGATYLVLAPEHALVEQIVTDGQRSAVRTYIEAIAGKSDVERQESREKTGVWTGAYALNPASGERIPVWIADYVLAHYGTGAIMAVPAHDERDFEFAREFDLPIRDAVHTRTLAAVAAFAERWRAAPIAGADAVDALADFLGLATSHPEQPFDETWQSIMRQRTVCALDPEVRLRREVSLNELVTGAATAEGLLGGGAGDRRGVVAYVWREALEPVLAGGVEALLRAAERAALVDHFGSPVVEPGVGACSSNAGVSLNGLPTAQAKRAIIDWMERDGCGQRSINYKLRDWLFSRQRYWGEPFPVVYDGRGVPRAVADDDLPVELPDLEDFRPVVSDTPTPLLEKAHEWAEVVIDGERYRRETNTMPNWAGSCWYYLRYCDPHNAERLVGREAERYWMGSGDGGGVDLYMGGAEHAVLHLLYARFWHKVLFDLGVVSSPEPFLRLRHQGLILSYAYRRPDGSLVPTDEVEEREENGQPAYIERATGKPLAQIVAKMSKSLKNVVNPDDVIAEFGADTFRLYEMYLGPIEASKPWSPRDIAGPFRFLQRLWRLAIDEDTGSLRLREGAPDADIERRLHATIRKVGADIDALSFNTAIASMIEFVNAATGPGVTADQLDRLVRILCPFAPHICEELWSRLGRKGFASLAPWPAYDEALLVEDSVEIPVQVNGKVKGRITVPAGADAGAIEQAALSDERINAALGGKPARKVIVVPGRMVNIVL